tara:strand:- start:1179 stop:1448 length:270 start_codon:yes stop_codon:yes gene_type:complete
MGNNLEDQALCLAKELKKVGLFIASCSDDLFVSAGVDLKEKKKVYLNFAEELLSGNYEDIDLVYSILKEAKEWETSLLKGEKVGYGRNC